LADVEAAAETSYDRFRRHFPKSRDITLVILKGHLQFKKPSAFSTKATVALLMWLLALAANAAEIKVLSSAAFLPVLNDLGPKFEKESGHRLLIQSDSGAGLVRRIEAGDPFDVVIISPEPIDALIKQKKI